MYKLDLPVDQKETRARERRRLQEEERKKRIFNPKSRTIGVDVNSLEAQAEERSRQRTLDKQRDEAFAADMKRNDEMAFLLEQRQMNDRRQIDKEIIEFRERHQRIEDRREFDIFDPDSKRKDRPARETDDDPRLTVSGLQKFQGEDLNSPARVKLQKEQNQAWLHQQMEEKERTRRQTAEADRLYALKMREMDERAMSLELADQDARKALLIAEKNYQRAQSDEMVARREQDKQQELDDNFTEMSNAIHGDLLSENPSVAASAFGPHRVIPDRWKGMSPSQVAEVRRVQNEQVLEKQRLKEAAEREEQEWSRQRLADARCAQLLERRENRTRKQILADQALMNQQLRQEQRKMKDHLDREVYTNRPAETFFSQFNTTTR
ncbi:RIB43A-like with coiled-coils protein 2 [Sycon ciliatum]|uniref:RIB43A-like with coiled-coils protein 2 n=1 Tax=Sycon ciliatum TaxID=27933 RepID=UPI0020AB0400|eukprot:scpid62144/ scgid17458/ RIB43A-like with coiled-coils protein 2